jgi:DNA-binding MarR family transcriptional regulator
MTKIIANLNELEWIKRIAVSNDARAWQIAMAPKGQIALEGWRLRLGTALAPDFLDLSPEETMTLVRAIDLIESRLDLPVDAAAAA